MTPLFGLFISPKVPSFCRLNNFFLLSGRDAVFNGFSPMLEKFGQAEV